jgi:hypothetical protein
MLDDIERDVAKKGYCEIMTVALANLCFKSTNEKSSQQRLDEWCDARGYTYEVFDGRDAYKKPSQWVRFYRRR